MTPSDVAARVRAVLAQAPVVDGHNDLAWALLGRADRAGAAGPVDVLDVADLAVDQSAAGLHTDLPRLRAGGVGGQFWSVYVPDTLAAEAAVVATLEQIDTVRRLVARHPDDLMLATTAEDVERAAARGRIAALLGMEGGHCIAGSLGVLRMMAALGVRYLTLTHRHNTPWADSATDTPAVGGLSDFGREVVRECNRLGVLVDLSHVAASTMHAALDVSAAPAFFSHSNARALCGHPRNVPDDVLGRVRDSGGIVMATFVPVFLTEECRAWSARGDGLAAEEEAAWLRANPRPPCDVRDVADHIEHIRAVAGVDHVGLGGDFDGTTVLPDGLDGVHGYPTLLAELATRGWADADLAKLTRHNVLRVMRATEAVSGPPPAARHPG